MRRALWMMIAEKQREGLQMPEIYYEPHKYPYGLKIYNCAGSWFVDRETPSKLETLAIFDDEYKARRYAQKLVLKGK